MVLTRNAFLKRPIDGVASNDAISKNSDAHVFAVPVMVSTTTACLLPTFSIIVLYFVSSLPRRFAIAVAFEVLFSMCRTSLSNTR